MFKIKDMADWKRERQKIINDVSYDLRDDLREEVERRGYPRTTSEKIEYFGPDKVVGSEHFSIAVMDAGRIPGEWPPLNKIRDWVQYVKDNGANKSLSDIKLNEIAWKVSKKIKEEGIEATWFVKDVLRSFTS